MFIPTFGMATRNVPDDFSSDRGIPYQSGNLYQLLGVRSNASLDEIQHAYRKTSRLVHPDRNPSPHAEEVMKRVNEAKSVLFDATKRRDYDEKLLDGSDESTPGSGIPLLSGKMPSEEFKRKFIHWANSGCTGANSHQFGKKMKEELSKLMKEKVMNHSPSKKQDVQPVPKPATAKPRQCSLLEMVSSETSELYRDPEGLQNAAKIQEIVQQAYKSGPFPERPDGEDNQVPLLNVFGLSTSQLNTLSQLFFLKHNSVNAQQAELLQGLVHTLPKTGACLPADPLSNVQCQGCNCSFRFFTKAYPCVGCGWRFCDRCLNEATMSLPRHGILKAHNICQRCTTVYYEQDVEEWVAAGEQRIAEGTLDSMYSAMACFTIALVTVEQRQNGARLLLKLAKGLVHNHMPEIATVLVLKLVELLTAPTKERMQAYLIASSAYFEMFTDCTLGWKERWDFLLASKDACLRAADEHFNLAEVSLEIPELVTRKSEIDAALLAHVKEIEEKHDQQITATLAHLEQAWANRNVEEIFSILTQAIKPTDPDVFRIVGEANPTLQACHKFLDAKNVWYGKMLPEDRGILQFLRAVLKLKQGDTASGLADLQDSVWSSHLPKPLSDAAIDAVLSQLNTGCMEALPFQEFINSCQLLQTNLTKDSLLCMKESQLDPPFSQHWPHLCVPGLNLKAVEKYENAIVKKVRQGEWTAHEAALAYIDLTKGCEHPAQVTVCFMNAALWFLSQLRVNASKRGVKKQELYAIKMVMVEWLQIAYLLSSSYLHAGMKLYIARVALAAMINVAKHAYSVLSPADGEFIVTLLRQVAHSGRLCPFWNSPTVSASEAVLLSIFTCRFHCEFVLGLQHVNPKHWPVTQAELSYQLYENDLRRHCSLEDSAGTRTKAMEELLNEKGWSFEDVSRLMCSPFTPRDEDGWLKQQYQLGMKLEFAALKGVVIDFNSDSPKIELLIEKANPRQGTAGLFSMQDVETVFAFPRDEIFPIFFSLDPPNEHYRYHPFQRFRYSSEELYNTNLLHTLFITDYLLKSFSVGSDVSAKPPFKQRPNNEGLTKSLPADLRAAIRPVSERGVTGSTVSRFWIQAGELVVSEKHTGSKIEFLFGEPEMVIHSHRMFANLIGKLEDMEEEDDPESPEAKFAKDMTLQYNNLCHYFPQFARLRELVKVQLVGAILYSVLTSFKETAADKNVTVPEALLKEVQTDAQKHYIEKVSEMLTDLQKQVGVWPSASDPDTISRHARLFKSTLPYEQMMYVNDWELEGQIKSALRDKDQKVLSQVCEVITQVSQSRLHRSTIEPLVLRWLSEMSASSGLYTASYRSSSSSSKIAENELLLVIVNSIPLPTRQEIKEQIIKHHSRKCDKFGSLLDLLMRVAKSNLPKISKMPCIWVPSAVSEKESLDGTSFSFCYGGVCIAPKIKFGYVHPSRHSSYPVTPTSFRTCTRTHEYQKGSKPSKSLLIQPWIAHPKRADSEGDGGGAFSQLPKQKYYPECFNKFCTLEQIQSTAKRIPNYYLQTILSKWMEHTKSSSVHQPPTNPQQHPVMLLTKTQKLVQADLQHKKTTNRGANQGGSKSARQGGSKSATQGGHKNASHDGSKGGNKGGSGGSGGGGSGAGGGNGSDGEGSDNGKGKHKKSCKQGATCKEEQKGSGIIAPEHKIIVSNPEIIVAKPEIIVPEPEIIVPEPEIIVPEPEIIVPEPEIMVPKHKITSEYRGTSPCGNKSCHTCQYIREGIEIKSTSTGRTFRLCVTATCRTKYVIYLIQCKKCGKQYVGRTTYQLNRRFWQHLNGIRNGKIENTVPCHFHSTGHSLSDISVMVIEALEDQDKELLKEREDYWIEQLQCLAPKGMNKIRACKKK